MCGLAGQVDPGRPNPDGTAACPRTGGACTCRTGWTGPACDTLRAGLRLVVTVAPARAYLRVVAESAGRPGQQVVVGGG